MIKALVLFISFFCACVCAAQDSDLNEKSFQNLLLEIANTYPVPNLREDFAIACCRNNSIQFVLFTNHAENMPSQTSPAITTCIEGKKRLALYLPAINRMKNIVDLETLKDILVLTIDHEMYHYKHHSPCAPYVSLPEFDAENDAWWHSSGTLETMLQAERFSAPLPEGTNAILLSRKAFLESHGNQASAVWGSFIERIIKPKP